MIAPGTVGFLVVCLLGYAAFASLLGFMVMAIDKGRAKRGEWRIPERVILMLALAGGWAGVKVAQSTLRHKTVKQPFRNLITLIGLVHALLLAGLMLPGVWIERGAKIVMDVAAPLTVSAAAVGNMVSETLQQTVSQPFSFGPASDEDAGKSLPRRFGPGSE